MSELVSVNTDSLNFNNLSYSLDLNGLGHEHDGTLSLVAKVGVAVAVVGAVAATGGAAAAGATATSGATAATGAGATAATGAATAVDTALTVGTITNVADTASDVASIISNSKTRRRIETAMTYAGQAQDKMEMVERYNSEYGQKMGSKGIVESMVGFVTDKTWGKPQRLRAIRNYIDTSLTPEFKQSLNNNHINLISLIRNTLEQAAAEQITQKESVLRQLKEEMEGNKQALQLRREKLNEDKSELVIL